MRKLILITDNLGYINLTRSDLALPGTRTGEKLF